MPDVVPAGLPVPLVAADAGWIALGAVVIEVKAALDAAVSEAKGTWTGEAADAFTEWWESRSAPMLEIGAACEAVAATLTAAVAETTVANVTWTAAAAAAAGLAPAIPAAGTVAWEGGLPAIMAVIEAAVMPLLVDPFTAAAGAAIQAECTAAASTVFALVTASIASSAAAVAAVGALATATVGAMVIGVDDDVPQGSALDTALGVGLSMAGGLAGAGFAAGSGLKALKGADNVAKTASDAPMPFKGRPSKLTPDASGGTHARPAKDPTSHTTDLDEGAAVGPHARPAKKPGATRPDLDESLPTGHHVRPGRDPSVEPTGPVGTRGLFDAPNPRTATEEEFSNWLKNERIFNKYGPVEGDCAPAAQEIGEALKKLGYKVKYRGILLFSADPTALNRNHFVVVTEIGGRKVVIDPTQGQFRNGGGAQIAGHDQWAARFKTLWVGDTYDGEMVQYEPRKSRYKDFKTFDEANNYAKRGVVRFGDAGGHVLQRSN